MQLTHRLKTTTPEASIRRASKRLSRDICDSAILILFFEKIRSGRSSLGERTVKKKGYYQEELKGYYQEELKGYYQEELKGYYQEELKGYYQEERKRLIKHSALGANA
jgi:hypothetical protein